jgi:hypothetical protein
VHCITFCRSGTALEVIAKLELHNRPEDHNLLPAKRRIIFWDCQRAESCILADYLSPSPKFSLDDFKRMFRVSRDMCNESRSFLCEADPFFCYGFDAMKRKKSQLMQRL